MTHPLAYMLAHRPQMLAVHAQAYGDLHRRSIARRWVMLCLNCRG